MDSETEKKDFRFPKTERLCLRRAFDLIYTEGTPVFVKGVRFIYYILNTEQVAKLFPHESGKPLTRYQIAFTVPKKIHRRAVDRNLLKRRMREVFRYRKHFIKEFAQTNDIYIYVLAVYLSKKKYNHAYLSKIFDLGLSAIINTVNDKEANNDIE